MPRRVFITVAEVSGDGHAGNLARQLRAMDPSLVIEGHGGPAMRAAGVTVHHDTVSRAAMGLAAAFRAVEIRRVLAWTRKYFDSHRPDLHVCCDSWTMNVHFAKLAHRRGVPVLYYIAPQVWASREGRIKKLQAYVDRVACILPFEEEYFHRRDVPATFVGHPLFDQLPPHRPDPDPAERFPHRPPVIGLLPGSRRSIGRNNFPHLLDVANRIRAEFPGATFLIPTTEATHGTVVEALRQSDPARNGNAAPPSDGAPAAAAAPPAEGTVGPFRYQLGGFAELVPRCDLCITVSGTATLHVAGYHVPMIVVYRGNPVLWHLLGRWVIKTRTYSLVNLLSDAREHIVPEFIPWYGSNAQVAERAMEHLRRPELLEQQRERLRQLIRALEKPGASRNAAGLALEMLTARAGTITGLKPDGADGATATP